MLKEHDSLFRQIMIGVDLAIVTLAFFLAYFLRAEMSALYFGYPVKNLYPLSSYLGLLPLILALWAGSLSVTGAYRPFRGRTFFAVLFDILKTSLLTVFIFAGLAYLFKFHFLSRFFIVLTFLLAAFLISFERILMISILGLIRKKGYNYRYLLIVGTGNRAQSFLELVENHPEWGFRIAGLIDDDPALVGQKFRNITVIGTLLDVPKILERTVVDDVLYIVPRSWLGKIENTILYCEQVGKRVGIAVDLFTLQFAKASQSNLHDFPLLMFQSTTDKIGQLFIKRSFDLVLSFIFLTIFFPLFLIVGLLIKLTSPGPIFFKQTRSTLNGRIFTLYKFRTMDQDAEAKLEELRDQNEMSGPAFKMKQDPRVTPIGKWLRKFSIDEFPQFWNIFFGDMSFVGPRPPLPSEMNHYEPWQRRRLSMRPGLTCLWQIQGRNNIVNFDEWMKLDLEYIDRWSLAFDLKIFLQTIPQVLFGVGAK